MKTNDEPKPDKTVLTKSHMSADIQGILRHFKRKSLNGIIQGDNGLLSDKEAREELKRLQALGHKLIPCGDCEGFDPFGTGCPGHPMED